MIKDRNITVGMGEGLTRLDKFLKDHLPSSSRRYLQAAITKGLIMVNGKPAKKGLTLTPGDHVFIKELIEPHEIEVIPNIKVPVKIVHEDEDIIIVDKPSGIPTHPIDFDEKDTLANFLVAKFPEIKVTGTQILEPGIIHRLDTNTSGLMVAARNKTSFHALKSQFHNKETEKEYLALVIGVLTEGTKKIELPLGHHPKDKRKMKAYVSKKEPKKGRSWKAITLIEVKDAFDDYTLLKVKIKSGVTHQVRVHLSSIGHPIAGDRLYQSSKLRKLDKLGLTRHFLHASKLRLKHPTKNKFMEFESPLPDELKKALEKLYVEKK